jgi:hypothetical protein
MLRPQINSACGLNFLCPAGSFLKNLQRREQRLQNYSSTSTVEVPDFSIRRNS